MKFGCFLADIQLLSKFNKGILFLLHVINIYSKYTWVILVKDKIYITITNVFQKISDESRRKPNKIWVGKGSESYNINQWYHSEQKSIN